MNRMTAAEGSHIYKARKRITLTAIAVTMGAAIAIGPAIGASASVASASVIRGYTVNVRAASNTGAQILRTVSSGARLGLNCYEIGTAVRGPYGVSSIWYSIDGGGFVSDSFIETGSNSAVTGRCNAAPAPTASSREAKAAAWAKSQMGRTTDDFGRQNSGWCLRWSVGAYGKQAAGYPSAIAMYQAMKNAGKVSQGTPPAGTLVWFAANRVNGNSGHVGIATGDGRIYSTVGDGNRALPNQILNYSQVGANYIGWSYAPDGWTR